MATNDFFLAQLEHRIDYLERHPDHLYPAGTMQVLLGDDYEAYAETTKVSLESTDTSLSVYADDWSRRANELLIDVNRALNLGHVTIEPGTSAQQKRAEKYQSRAEELMYEYDNYIRGTLDAGKFSEPTFEELGVGDLYFEAQHLLEHWVIPIRQQNTPGIDKRSYLRRLQSESLGAALQALKQGRCEPAASPTASPHFKPRAEVLSLKKLRRRGLLD